MTATRCTSTRRSRPRPGSRRRSCTAWATYGIVCKALTDTLLDGDTSRVLAFGVRFAGVVYPGETLRTAGVA